MAALNHVCMWREKGWKRVTAEEAARIHPGGTVSAKSGLFMCEICGQYVVFTNGKEQSRHFRHSSSEKVKECPERVFGAYGYAPEEHELPIRIVNITNRSFSFEMGFIPVDSRLLTSKLQIIIKPNSSTSHYYYAKERLNLDGITYLPIGNVPTESYGIEIAGAANADMIHQYWPRNIQGIDPKGTVFDATTGKKLVYDADVVVDKKYYLLHKGSIFYRHISHVTCREICRQMISGEVWYVYEVVANDYDMEAAKFFMDYHCRLTEEPISIQPVWPVYVEGPYIIKHSRKCMVIHLTGNVTTTQVYPYAPSRNLPCAKGMVLEIDCNRRQQLISAGRTKALQYAYFWQEPLMQSTESPTAVVTDLHDIPIECGENHKLPDQKILRITIPYDGMLVIRQDEAIIDKCKLKAQTATEIDNIAWNMELSIYVGMDAVWEACFCKEINHSIIDEAAILHRLVSCNGQQMPVSHTIGSLAARLYDYPRIRQWLYKCIRRGYISRRAHQELQAFIRKIELNN